jgi:hypothetical protein
MSRLPRPYIPLSVRADVAVKQATANGMRADADFFALSCREQIRQCLQYLFGSEPVHLDHNPALENRQKLYHNGVHVAYSPPANDPEYLIYRTKHDHHIKTNVRGDGAQYPDRVLAKRERRRARKKRKYRWASRPLRSKHK